MRKSLHLIVTISLIAVMLSGCGAGSKGSSRAENDTTSLPALGNSSYSERYDSFGVNGSSSYSQSKSDYSEYSDGYTEDYEYDMGANTNAPLSEVESGVESGVNSGVTETTPEAEITLAEEKLVYTCDITIETTEYKDSMAKLYEVIDSYDGIIQSSYERDSNSNWYYTDYAKTRGTLASSLSVRVPSKNYKAMVESLGNIGQVTSKSSEVENISQKYYDTSTRVEALEIEQARLLEMLSNASEIESMIAIEARLSEVESDLMSLKTEIKYMDMDVAYSYVYVNVNEVMEYTEQDVPVKTNKFVDRLINQLSNTWRGLLNNLEGLLFIIIGIAPYLVIIGLAVLVYRKLIKKLLKPIFEKRKAKKAKSGDISIKDMNNMLKDLSEKIKDKKDSDKQ